MEDGTLQSTKKHTTRNEKDVWGDFAETMREMKWFL